MDKLNETDKKNLEIIENSIKVITMYKGQTVNLPPPIICWDGQALIYPRTINIIQGKSGVHKSRFAEIIIRSLLAKEKSQSNFMNIIGAKEMAVCYIDTERNIKYQFAKSIGDIERACGYSGKEKVDHFHYASFIEIPRKERLNSLKAYISKIRETEKEKHLVIFFDVITDFIMNFNSESESLLLIDFLNNLIQKKNCTLISVIHENPGNSKISGKARGHLGSELGNKSSLTLSLSFERKSTSQIKIEFLKARGYEKLPIKYAEFDQTKSTLVLIDKSKTSAHLLEKKEVIASIHEIFSKDLTKTLNTKDLRNQVKNNCDVPNLRREKIINSIIDDKELIRIDDKQYSLVFTKKGKEKLFGLKEFTQKNEY